MYDNQQLPKSHKNMYIFEALFVYCLRHDIAYCSEDDELMDSIVLSSDDSVTNELDDIAKDLRLRAANKHHIFTCVTQEEFSQCLQKFKKS